MRMQWTMTFGTMLLLSFATFAWNAGELTVDVVPAPMSIKVSAGGKTLAEVTGISFGTTNYTSIASTKEFPDSLVLTLSASCSLTITKVISGIRMYGKVAGAQSVAISMKDQGDHFFGLLEYNFNDTPDMRGLTVKVGMCQQRTSDGYGSCGWGISAHSAFYMSSQGYGSFFDSFANGEYVLGSGGLTKLSHQTGTLDWYLFYGPTGDKIHNGYYHVIGKPRRLPVWACGPAIWRDENANSQQIIDDVKGFTDLKIPVSHIWVDRPYTSGENGWGNMDFGSNFANPGQWIGTLNNEYNVRFETWITPSPWGELNVCPAVLSGGNNYIDLSSPEAYTWYKERLKTRQHQYGVQGHKIDRCDQGFIEDDVWTDGTPRPERYNRFNYLHPKAAGEALQESHGDDWFSYARSAYHRSQPFLSAVWGGDVQGGLDGLLSNMENGMRCSYMGFPVFGSDGGSYWGNPDDNVHQRWLQFCLWSGFFEWKLDGRLPWNRSKTVQDVFRRTCEDRMQLLPYIYSIANTSDRLGAMMRPMSYMYPDDSQTWSISEQYLFGPAFLVAAPVPNASNDSRTVYLPQGTWVNYYDYAQQFSGKQTVTLPCPADKAPVLVKRNSIFVTGAIFAGNAVKWTGDSSGSRAVTVHAFPGSTGTSTEFLYVDFLDSDKEKNITLSVDTRGIIHVASPSMTVGGNLLVQLGNAPHGVFYNGNEVASPSYNSTRKVLTVPFRANEEIVLQIGGDNATAIPQNGNPFILLSDARIACNGSSITLHLPNCRNAGGIEYRLRDSRGRIVKEATIETDLSAQIIKVAHLPRQFYILSVRSIDSGLERSWKLVLH